MKCLLLSASAGAGHTRAAQALEATAKNLDPMAEIRHVDILDFTDRLYKKAYAGSYLRMIDRAPAIWGFLYEKTNRVQKDGLQKRISRAFDKIQFASFRKFVREFQPDVVLSTHFLACQILGPYRKKGRDLFPLGVVITDFDVHAFWVDKTVDHYFVGNEELEAILAGKGIEPSRIHVTGIPIMPGFTAKIEPEPLRRSLGLDTKRPTVLIMSGGAGVGSMRETVCVALQSGLVQVLAVAGRNEKLKQELEKLELPQGSSLSVFGFTDQIASLMSVADLAITKSGGLTTSECLAMGLPMVVREPVPGQEERNCDYLVEAGAGIKANGVDSLRYKLRMLLTNKQKLQAMKKAAKSIGRPNAAASVLKIMFGT